MKEDCFQTYFTLVLGWCVAVRGSVLQCVAECCSDGTAHRARVGIVSSVYFLVGVHVQKYLSGALRHTATHCNALQRTATRSATQSYNWTCRAQPRVVLGMPSWILRLVQD